LPAFAQKEGVGGRHVGRKVRLSVWQVGGVIRGRQGPDCPSGTCNAAGRQQVWQNVRGVVFVG